MNYYNEWDPQAAAWLRELIAERLIPRGLVDERSITEVKAEDLEGFTQCHFFAGIGGWPLALQLAGISHRTPLWTGSPPCQPFSAAGKQLGQFDPRHLAPVFLNLISECRPPVLFGEQVAPAIAKSWMCDLQAHLEGEDYAVGFAVLPACSVGAPHKRDRLFFGAHNLAESLRAERDGERDGEWLHGLGKSNQTQGSRTAAEPTGRGDSDRMADASGCGRQQQQSERPPSLRGKTLQQTECELQSGDACTIPFSMGDTDSERLQRERRDSDSQGRKGPDFRQAGLLDGAGAENSTTNSHHGFWSDSDWLGCRDGKFRPVEPSTFPLANGIPARVGRLRGYGNAIVPQVAAEFITAFMGAAGETFKD